MGVDTESDCLGLTDFDFFAAEHAQAAREDELRVMRTGEAIVDLEEREVWPDGRITWVSTTKVPLYSRDGRVIGIFGLSRDITARKLAEERSAPSRLSSLKTSPGSWSSWRSTIRSRASTTGAGST